MTILVTGATGTIGSQIVQRLADQGASVRALVRDKGRFKGPPGVEPVQGNMHGLAELERTGRIKHAARADRVGLLVRGFFSGRKVDRGNARRAQASD